jgi:L-ascorbate metabolism protein UlaG (beta-lactamase superfamily)
MDVQFYGANCLGITYKGVRLIIDDNLAELGAKSVTKPGDIVAFTGSHAAPQVEVKLLVDHPGEYEVAGVSIIGVSARAHMDEADKRTATVYKIVTGELSVLVVGHIYPELSEEQLETIGIVDAMFIPVGGNGYTLDAVGALTIIKEVEPKLIIPTHYDEAGLKYPVPQQTLDQALKGLGMESKNTTAKLKLKPSELSDVTQLIVLERS